MKKYDRVMLRSFCVSMSHALVDFVSRIESFDYQADYSNI